MGEPLKTNVTTNTAVLIPQEKPENIEKKQDGRVIVFHGGFFDPKNEYPAKLANAWEENGVPKDKIYLMPNCYVGTEELLQDAAVQAPKSCKNPLSSALKACSRFIAKIFHMVTDTVKNLFKFNAFSQPKSQENEEKVRCLNAEMKKRGYTPDKPALISLVAHSGGAAPVTGLATAAKNSKEKLAFRVVEITTFGSPLTEAELENIPNNTETNIVVSKQDSVCNTVRQISGYASVLSYFGFSSCQVKIVKAPQSKLKQGTTYIELENGGHSDYHSDKTLMKRIVEDSLTEDIPPQNMPKQDK